MTKTMTCDKCNGRGYFDFPRYGPSYAGVTVLRCEVCQGKGMVDVPITNADHIRSMTDVELAEWMNEHNVSCGICSEYVMCGGEVVFGDRTCDCDCATHYLNWLKQPWKEKV